MVKRNGAQFTSEPNNLTNLNSFKYSGLACNKTIGISSVTVKDGKGVVISSKKAKVPFYKPAKTTHKVTLSRGIRKAAESFTNAFTRAGYRPDLRKMGVHFKIAIMNGPAMIIISSFEETL
ncbi:4781_t:CDS:2 [Scutellospora calospora]|uniref:4781_t:CDS:1 n=1 Tax=Scutellospora calospora TaxID=85575 RepID=A0ACA9KCW3_9GLOM|nr:4781_t:CDS:2 [Scutellospora calospora]